MQCDIVANVDFGRGPVEVRCTETEKGHDYHRCLVEIQVDLPNLPVENNIFAFLESEEKSRFDVI